MRSYTHVFKVFATWIGLLALAVLTVGPFLWLLVTALKGGGENIFAYPPSLWPAQPTLDNFRQVWEAVPFGRYFFNSVLVAVVAVALNLILASLAAFPLARMRFRGREPFFVMILATMMIPLPVIMIPLFILSQRLGLLNSYSGLILPTAVSAFGIFLMRQAFLAIPREIEEAAVIDGANPWQVFWQVMLPLTKPSLATLAIFVFVGSWGDFLWPLIVLKDPDLYTLPVGISYLAGTFSANWRLIAAGSVLSIIPIVAVFIGLQRFFIGGQTAGAVKG
ncbi:L-arabinose transport system permease protein AraQ [compost metagenome]